jgi:hypothetical protein
VGRRQGVGPLRTGRGQQAQNLVAQPAAGGVGAVGRPLGGRLERLETRAQQRPEALVDGRQQPCLHQQGWG